MLFVASTDRACFAPQGFDDVNGNTIQIGEGCRNFGTILHLIGHALGLHHTHLRPDAGLHLSIDWSSVTPGTEYLFKPFNLWNGNLWATTSENSPYDLYSIMHWGPCHYSITQEYGGELCHHTLDVKMGEGVVDGRMGQRGQFSLSDGLLLRKMYRCPTPGPVVESTGVSPAEFTRINQCILEDASKLKWKHGLGVPHHLLELPSDREILAYEKSQKNFTNTAEIIVYVAVALLLLMVTYYALDNYILFSKASRSNRQQQQGHELLSEDDD